MQTKKEKRLIKSSKIENTNIISLVISLNVKGINTLIKRHSLVEWISFEKKQTNMMYRMYNKMSKPECLLWTIFSNVWTIFSNVSISVYQV